MNEDLVEKYKRKLTEQLELKATTPSHKIYSTQYAQFRKELMPARLSYYEKLCKISGTILKMKVKPQTALRIQKDINAIHLQVTPSQVLAASVVAPILFMIFGVFGSLYYNSTFFALFSLFAGVVAIIILQKVPGFLSNSWRMKSSNQMVLCIFYIVTYMRHTSNLELAVEFASQHLSPPLSLDLRKVIWDVENSKFENIKESLDFYLEGWRDFNLEFVEAFHLIQSSLYESSEERRLSLLDKSLDVILDETYEKMLHYAQNLKGPLTMLHMLGVILPILGLVILPLVVSFMEGIAWYHIATLYNVILPISVYILGKNILSNRPSGYGDTDVTDANPELKKYKNINFKIMGIEFAIHPAFIAIIVFVVLFTLALSPLIIHIMSPNYDLTIFGFDFLGYKESSLDPNIVIGPFGLWSSIISLLFPASLGISIGIYFRLRSNNVIAIRNKAKQLEDEFASALFQLGNRLGDGLPAEIAIPKVAQIMKDTTSGQFFRLVTTNIVKLGMSVSDALFNPQTGAVVSFPSAIIDSSMKVLIESIRKGPIIAAQALLNIARYIKEIHKVDERLKDLMADIISDMKSQIAFLTPMIAGIVIGITSMITYILGNLGKQITQLGQDEAGSQIGALSSFFADSVPTYYFQAVVGIYVFQIVYILTILANGIENGSDSLQERYLLGRNTLNSTLLYCIIAGAVMLVFNIIAQRIVGAALIAV